MTPTNTRSRAPMNKKCRACQKPQGSCPQCRGKLRQKKLSATAILRQYKQEKGCKVCSYNGPALAFHHTKPDIKEGKINATRLLHSDIRDELASCVIVCHNCHYELHEEKMHAKERGERAMRGMGARAADALLKLLRGE